MEYYRGDTWTQTSHRSQSRKREGIRTHAFEKAAVLLKLDPPVQDHFPPAAVEYGGNGGR